MYCTCELVSVGGGSGCRTRKKPSDNSTQHRKRLQIETNTIIHFGYGCIGTAIAGNDVRVKVFLLEAHAVDSSADFAVDSLRNSLK